MISIRESDILILADNLISEVTDGYISRVGSDYDPVSDRDTRLGDIPEEVRRLFAAASLAYARAQEQGAKAAGSLTEFDKDQSLKEGLLNHDLHCVLEALAFAALRRELGATVGLSIRKGWIAVQNLRAFGL